MASTCISSCVEDVVTRVPIRATYVNLHKWPESDFEFVRSMSYKTREDGGGRTSSVYGHPRVVDSISCRQLYLRSYTFSREGDRTDDDDDDKIVKCMGRRVGRKEKRKESRRSNSGGGGRLRRAKAASCSALASIFGRLLSCTTKVDVAI